MAPTLDLEARATLRSKCRRLGHHFPQTPAKALSALARWCEERELTWDHYGVGLVLEELEADIAGRFEKPAALFLPTGTMAQQIALKLWSEEAGTKRIAVPPHSHLELHEHDAHTVLSGLDPQALGVFERVPTAADLAAVADPLAAVLIELPAREIGGKLPTWEQLEEFVTAARARNIRVHLDGARAFEAASGYGCSLPELGALFDSIYISLYKGIGGFAGAILMGEKDWIEEARLWKRRFGGDPITLLPFAASAHMHLDLRASRMDDYTARSRELAQAFSAIKGVTVDPPEPRVNMMHLVLDAPRDAVIQARDEVAQATGLWLLNDPRTSLASDPADSSRIELTVGDATLSVAVEEAAAALADLVRRAQL
ncbi:MAG: threonine aldolase [Planctomycetota bacterium]|jgi:threonine aldolase